MRMRESDKLRAIDETLLTSNDRKSFGDKLGALRVATYISNYTDYKTWKEFIRKCTVDEYDDMMKYYVEDYANRPYTKVFQNHIGLLIKFKYEKTILCKILKRLSYNDCFEFTEYLENNRTLKKYAEKLK